MKKILFINACVRPHSRTYLLSQKVLEKLDGQINEIKLCNEGLSPLNWEQLEKRDQLISSKDFSAPMFKYANQFASADEIVIAAPYWDLAFPSILRIYFEHITIAGLTFTYSLDGIPVGLCKANRIIYITTAGGPIENRNLGYDYIKALSNTFYGIANVLCFKAENLDIKGADVDSILGEAITEINNLSYSQLKDGKTVVK